MRWWVRHFRCPKLFARHIRTHPPRPPEPPRPIPRPHPCDLLFRPLPSRIIGPRQAFRSSRRQPSRPRAVGWTEQQIQLPAFALAMVPFGDQIALGRLVHPFGSPESVCRFLLFPFHASPDQSFSQCILSLLHPRPLRPRNVSGSSPADAHSHRWSLHPERL